MYLIELFLVVSLSQSGLGQCRNGVITASGLSMGDKLDIMKVHNDLRQNVSLGRVAGQPPARDMMYLIWDSQLEARAQLWANNCVFAHSANVTLEGEPVGENLSREQMTGSDDLTLFSSPREMVLMWFEEVNQFNYSGEFAFQTAHYSQIIWGETTRLGCGSTTFQSQSPNNMITRLLVCNYFVAGNVLGQQPYTSGQPPCSVGGRSLVSLAPYYPGLCVTP